MNEDMMNFADLLANNEDLKQISELIEQIMSIPEESLTDDMIDIVEGMIMGAFTEKVKKDSLDGILNGFENENYTRTQAIEAANITKNEINNYIEQLQPSKAKRRLLLSIFNMFFDILDKAIEHYHNYSIELPIKLDDGAIVPTYAHDTDACADLYAADDMVLPAHTFSNMVRTGVHIALPEGWMAMIFPRSSIGAKTQNRLSNSVGIIDSEYRGQLGVLYDNLSDSDYFIKTGDRIAQMLVMPSYKFKANVVDILPASSRGEGGFGSTGK